jgi:hypothetical protein
MDIGAIADHHVLVLLWNVSDAFVLIQVCGYLDKRIHCLHERGTSPVNKPNSGSRNRPVQLTWSSATGKSRIRMGVFSRLPFAIFDLERDGGGVADGFADTAAEEDGEADWDMEEEYGVRDCSTDFSSSGSGLRATSMMKESAKLVECLAYECNLSEPVSTLHLVRYNTV